MVDTASLRQHLESDHNGTPPALPPTRHYPTADELRQRCNVLIAELEAFKEYLKSRRVDHSIEIAHFRNTVKSEHKTLERLAKSESQEATQHTVNSSNLPFLETVWSAVKRTTGLQALQKRFYWHGGLSKERAARQAISGRVNGRTVRIPDKRKESALVDVVSQDGSEWIKVSLITNTRLLFDKAKQGWEEVSSSEDSDEDGEEGRKTTNGKDTGDDDDDDHDIPLIKMAKELFKAAKTVRIRTNHPRIRLVLPKIEEGQIDAIDDILTTLRNMGCTVETSEHVRPPPPFTDIMRDLLSDPFKDLTPTLNIDCTILLALVSDFSHCSVEAEPWFHRALKRQVEIEDKENLLPNLLYPAIAGHRLVCTKEAATRMHEIVDTIGTPGEKARTKLFMMDAQSPAETSEAEQEEAESKSRRDQLQEWSKFEVPSDLYLPIRVVDSGIQLTNYPTAAAQADEIEATPSSAPAADTKLQDPNADADTDPAMSKLPASAKSVKRNLTWINQSVFLHGWLECRSTITSNRTVVKQIDHILDRHAESDKEWPNIWLCPTARSLVGKEKGRKE